MAKIYHIAISRGDLINMVAQKALPYSVTYDLSRGSFLDVLLADKRSWITLEPCNNQSADGECQGHVEE